MRGDNGSDSVGSDHHGTGHHDLSGKYSLELFSEACGALGPIGLTVEGGGRQGPFRRALRQPFVVVGRDPQADLFLDNWQVSRRHAYLQFVGGRLFCVDLGSRAGIVWDDGDRSSGWFDPGRAIRFGPFTVGRWSTVPAALETDAGRSASIPESPGLPALIDAGPACELDFLSGAPGRPPASLSGDLVLIGSDETCGIQLPHSDVSKAHCGLLKTEAGIWAVDLLGRGGIFVNDYRVRFARLDDGDALRIGRHILGLRVGRPASLAPHGGGAGLPATRPPRRTPGVPAPPSSGVSLAPNWRRPEPSSRRAPAEPGGAPADQQAELIEALMRPLAQQFGAMQQQMFEQFHQAMMRMLQSFGDLYREQMGDLREELDEVRRLTAELQKLEEEARVRGLSPPPATLSPSPSPAAGPHTSRTTTSGLPPGAAPKRPLGKPEAGVHGLLVDRIASLQAERQSRWQKILGMMGRTTG